ncbi:MAG TPA: SpoIIE family protein phosphatase [Solirubrobacteraceae bacterium]|nr:SpoIIE family protein phosphatase [Solirubrobacteraceae bacterium]
MESGTEARPAGETRHAPLGYATLEEVLEGLLERIRGELTADTAAVLLLDEERQMLVARAARGLEEEVRQGVKVPLARGFAGRVASERRPIVIEDLDDAEIVNPILRQRGIRSMLGVPLLAGGHCVGVMHVGTLSPRSFTEADVARLQLAADRAAVAIDEARIDEQRSVTEVMQRALLPDELPALPGLRFSAKYLPAGSGVKLGGDWYDVFSLPNGRLAFVIGDVVGRGVLAASVMAETRTALRAYLNEGHPLSDVMTLLNDLLVSMGRNRSATAQILELDFDSGELAAVSAAHLPPLLIERDGSATFLELHGSLPLGIVAGVRYETSHHRLPEGSGLLLYTDGLVERRREPLGVGLGRLQRAAEAAAAGGGELADRVYRALVDELPLDDDIALLAIESLALEGEVLLTLDADPAALAGLRRTIGRWLAASGATDDDVFQIALATSEAAANSIEHAYGAADGGVEIRCSCDGDLVRVVVRDRGRWRTSQPFGRGRGLMMMKELVDSARVETAAGGTTVTLEKRLAAT